MNKNKISLKNLIFGAHLVAIASILTQLPNWLGLTLKIPIINLNIWSMWYLPIIIIGFLFPFRQTIIFILLFILIEGYIHTIPNIISEQTWFNKDIIPSANWWNRADSNVIIKKWFLQAIIPISSYSIQPFVMKSRFFKKNYFLWFSVIIVLSTSISRGINGYCYWYETIISLFEKRKTYGGYNYSSEFWQKFYCYFKDSKIRTFIIIWFCNFVPIVISCIINYILFFSIKQNIIKLYEKF